MPYHLPMSRIAVMTLFCWAVCAAMAQTVVRPRAAGKPIWKPRLLWKFDDRALSKATVAKEMSTSLSLSGVTIPLEEESELEALQVRFSGEIGSQGDAGDYLGWLCFHGSDAIGPWGLWLESEIDGPYSADSGGGAPRLQRDLTSGAPIYPVQVKWTFLTN
jgi:hypothetical protein